MLINAIKIRRLPGMSMTGLNIEEYPPDPLNVIVRAGNITLANGVILTLENDTVIKITPDNISPMIAVISLTQIDGLVLNEWVMAPGEEYFAYNNGIFCDIAKFDIPSGCTSLKDVEVTIPILE